MKIIDIIASALGVPADLIRQALTAGIEALGPELAGGLQDLLAKFESAVTPESVASLVGSLTPELTEFLKGHLNPRNSPGNLA